jgi:hypothetical protein
MSSTASSALRPSCGDAEACAESPAKRNFTDTFALL